jgi:dethiobiotin synthetase
MLLMVDLIQKLEALPVLAARAGLGAINHTLLSLEILSNRGLQPAGILLLEERPASAPPDLVAENIEAIETFSGIEVVGVVKHIADFQRLEAVDLEPVRCLLGLQGGTRSPFNW